MEAIFLNPSQEYIGIFNEKQTSLFYAYGNIEETPKHEDEGDHKFIIVDLIKMQAQQIAVDDVNAIVPFTTTSIQAISGQININTIPTTITVNSMTANNILFSAENIMVNEEVYSNANE